MAKKPSYVRGNINLYGRPSVPAPEGGKSTVRSMSFEENGHEVLVPTVVGKRVVSDKEAIRHYDRTGQHLGKFSTVKRATQEARKIHSDYAAGLYAKRKVSSR